MKAHHDTKFAPAGRADDPSLQFQQRAISRLPFIDTFYDAVAEMVMILNEQRQIVFCNRNLADYLDIADKTAVYGKRPGEVFHCMNHRAGTDGCGTSEYCSACGAVDAVLESQAGRAAARECHISLEDGTAMELLMRATPFSWGDATYSIVAVTDISHEKRRRNLEQIFFHDIKNTVVGIRNLVAHLMEQENLSHRHFLELIHDNSIQLLEEIDAQRELMAAETGELKCRPESIEAGELLGALRNYYLKQRESTDKHMEVTAPAGPVRFVSDRTLLRRVLSNMIKNALEATAPGQAVTLGCETQPDDSLLFYVHNPGHMPPKVQMQVFHRFFSTKGAGRGLGTYAVKLLAERYLGGSVGFSSDAQTGTRFEIRIPRELGEKSPG